MIFLNNETFKWQIIRKFVINLSESMTTKKAIILIFALGVGATGAYLIKTEADKMYRQAEGPAWLETDSATAIQKRIESDFRLSRQQLLDAIRENHPEVTDADIDRFIAMRYVEVDTINGEQRFFRKSPRNINLLNPDYNGGIKPRGALASPQRISYVDSVLSYYKGTNRRGLSHRVTYRFTVDVPGNDIIADDTLTVWLPVPFGSEECSRQRDVQILNAEPAEYVLSDGKSEHNSICFRVPAPASGDTTHFEYVGRFVTSGAYRSAAEILKSLMPYDKNSELYKQYTAFNNRHIIRMDSLAKKIVGDETNPFLCSEMVYDYIIKHYPWAGAREYSTINCIPQYVLNEGHGDCGQVSLLYISLMRTLGIPARWESGWMLHPGEINLHDWAEVYFEGIGWLPVDVSFGRYSNSGNDEIEHFYSHGIDSHRLAANKNVGQPFFPSKNFVRSETVDFQVGEVECSKGNLFYPAWNYNLEVITSEPIEEPLP